MNQFSVYIFILTNIVLLAGVWFLDWSLSSIVFIYWMEGLILGFYSVFKMFKMVTSKRNVLMSLEKALIRIFLFATTYGLFVLIHRSCISSLFDFSRISSENPSMGWILLLTAHGLSYLSDFISREEYRQVHFKELIIQPFQRSFVVQLTVLISAFVIRFIGIFPPDLGISIVIIIKTLLDSVMYLKERPRPRSFIMSL